MSVSQRQTGFHYVFTPCPFLSPFASVLGGPKVCSGFSVRWYGNKIFGQCNNKGWLHIMCWLFEKTYSRCFNNKFIFCRIFAIILLSKVLCLTLLTTLWNWSGRYISFLFYRRKLRLRTTECTNDKTELKSTSLDLPQHSSWSFSRRYNI